jgi:hypothetical protein
MKAAVNYDAKASCTDIQFKEKVFVNKDLVVSHKASKEQDLSMVGLAWSFWRSVEKRPSDCVVEH